MKRFNAWVNSHPPAMLDCLVACHGRPMLRPVESGRRIVFPARSAADAIAPAGLRPDDWRVWIDAMAEPDMRVQTCVISSLFHDGIKAYAPTPEEWLALSQVEMNVPWSAYRQPFPTVVTLIPECHYPDPVSEGLGRPAAVITRHDPAARVFLAVYVGDHAVKNLMSHYCWSPDSAEAIEGHFRGVGNPHQVDSDEMAFIDRAKRVAMNANMLLTHSGAVRLGAANPEYDARLRSSLAKKSLPPAVRAANERELRKLPTLYGFDQHVRVYEREGGPAHGGGSGHEVKPHWRRGHWAHQPCGAGRAERRLVFRPAVMVNAHRFGGRPADTRLTMTTA